MINCSDSAPQRTKICLDRSTGGGAASSAALLLQQQDLDLLLLLLLISGRCHSSFSRRRCVYSRVGDLGVAVVGGSLKAVPAATLLQLLSAAVLSVGPAKPTCPYGRGVRREHRLPAIGSLAPFLG